MKRSLKMVVLLAVLVVFVGGYAVVTNLPADTQTVSETEGQFALFDGDASAIAALDWTDGETAWRFEREDGVWVNAYNADFPVNQTVLDSLCQKAAALTATRALSDVSNPADYGLAEPAFTLNVTDESGAQTAYTLGDETPFEDGYYVGVSGQDTIYTVAEPFSDAFDLTISELAEMEAIPQVESFAAVTVSGAVNAAYDEASGTWSDAETGEALDTEAVETLANDIKALSWSALATANATDEELSEWMLDDLNATAVALYDAEGETALCFMIGGTDESGNFYARLPDSRRVYTFMAEDVEDILASGIDTLWRKQPVTLTYDALAQAEFTFEGGSVTVIPPTDVEEAEESDEADGETEEAAGDPGESVFAMLTALSGTERIEARPSGEAVLSVAIMATDGTGDQLAFYPYDVDSYLLPVTDSHAMLVSADSVDKLIRALRQML